MRFLHADNTHSEADNIIRFLTFYNRLCTPETRILDFGCGSGALVYEFREKGYCCDGFEIRDCIKYKVDAKTGDVQGKEFFHFNINAPSLGEPPNYSIAGEYHLPFEDNSYDLVVSTGVLEHVMNFEKVTSEISRILRPRGVVLHFFPTRTFPVERHIHVPFASYFSKPWYPWLLFWARMGVRMESQKGLPPERVADLNFQYCTTGLRYLSDKAYIETTLRYFEWAQFSYYCRRPAWWRKNWKKILRMLFCEREPLKNLCTLAENRCLCAFFPKNAPPSSTP